MQRLSMTAKVNSIHNQRIQRTEWKASAYVETFTSAKATADKTVDRDA